MSERQPIFRLIGDTLTAPNGQDIDDTIAGLARIDPRRADDGEPCVACPESYEFALRLPQFDEHLYIEDGPEHTCLEIFWAVDDASGQPVLMVYDRHVTGENAMIAIPEDDKWHRLEPGGQLLRRFANAAGAREQFPRDEVFVNTRTANWRITERHHWDNVKLAPSNFLESSPDGFLPKRILGHVPIATWHEQLPGAGTETRLVDVSPMLAASLQEEFPNSEVEDESRVSTIIVEILFIDADTGPAMAVVLFQGFHKRDYVRFLWRELRGEEMLTAFPRKLPRE